VIKPKSTKNIKPITILKPLSQTSGKQSYPTQDEPERKSHTANILSNNLFLSNCTFLAISLSVYLLAVLSNILSEFIICLENFL